MLTYYVKINFWLLLSFKETGYQLERGSHQRDGGGPSLDITLNTFAFKFPLCRHSITRKVRVLEAKEDDFLINNLFSSKFWLSSGAP